MLSIHSETAGGSWPIAHRSAMKRAVVHFLVLACVTGCVSNTGTPVPADGGSSDSADESTLPTDLGAGDAGVVATDVVGVDAGVVATDVLGIDAGEGGCGAQFISGQFAPAGQTSGRFCLPLPNGVTVNHSNCRPQTVSVNVEGPPYVNAGGAPDMFTAAGSTVLGFAIDGRGLPCAAGAEACQFRTIGAQCAATVVQSGGLNQVVEVALQGSCVLRQYDVAGNAVAEMSLDALRMRGTLRLFQDVSTRSDGAVVDACE